MNRKGGTAVAAGLLAILGVSYLSRQGAESRPALETGKSTQKQALGGAGAKKETAISPVQETVSPPAQNVIYSCKQIARHLTRFYTTDPPVPDSCLPDPSVRNKVPAVASGRLSFVIALVANPVQTHLPLLFDRTIEVIQQAAQDENYAYDSSWFPWNHTAKSYDLLSDQEEALELEAKLQEQPGIVVFRRGLDKELVDSLYTSCEGEVRRGELDPKCGDALERSKSSSKKFGESYEEGLVVFVVAEQPTGGISDVEFENALRWMEVLRANHTDEPLRILGPTFSGSLPSLARELEAKTIPQSPSRVLVNVFQQYSCGILIYSGSTSSEGSVRWFQLFLARHEGLRNAGPNQEARLRFRTLYESDSLMTDRFLCYLHHEGYQLGKVAILSEDETAFGREPSRESGKSAQPGSVGNKTSPAHSGCWDQANPEESPIYLYYPRDIATLRSAYEQQSIFSAGKPQGNAPTSTLRGDLSEPASSEHDTVRTYAGQLTPLGQESVLFGIANVLNAKYIEFVILRSSNTLDQLFLSEFLRRSYPGGRVVIDGSDLLFRRGMQGASLRGVLLLSPYPLLSWTQDSIPKFHGSSSRSYRVFDQDATEGLYIAARELLDPSGVTASVPVSDYAPPRWALKDGDYVENRRPATWLAVVGHRQFWPVAVLNSYTQSEGPNRDPEGAGDLSLLAPEVFPPSGGSSQASWFHKARLPGEMVGLLAICLMLGVFHVCCCWKGSITRSPRLRAYFAPTPRVQHLVLVFLGSLIIGCLGMLLAFSLKSGLRSLTTRSAVSAFVTASALVVFGFLACLTNYSLPVLSAAVSRDESIRIVWWRPLALWLWPLLLIMLSLLRYYFLTSRLDASNLQPTFWRIVYLRSGVSPLLPQVLLLVGLYAWFWFSLQGLSLFGADRPVLPRKKDLPEFDVPAGPELDRQSEDGHKIKAFRMFSREDAGDHIEAASLPLTLSYLKSLAFFLLFTTTASGLALGGFSLRSLGDRHFGTLIFLGVCLCIAILLADALQFLRTWSRLRQLLVFLDRLRLRRTLEALKGLSWDSVWKMSGNVLEQRYHLISRQFESMRNLKNTLDAWNPTATAEIRGRDATLEQLKKCEGQGSRFAEWYVNLCDPADVPPVTDITPLQNFQEELAATAGCVMKQLIVPAWQRETQSLVLKVGSSGEAPHDENDKKRDVHNSADAVKTPVQAAEEFFLLPYLGFIQNTMGRIRSIAMSILALFVAATLAVSSYPFDPLPVIGAIFLTTFALFGATVIFVYAGIHRDATLSRITNTRPGVLGFDFWARLFAFGVGPSIGLLTTLFPSITDFVVSWLQPGAQAIR
jgi:hypothetical protein